MKHEENTSIYKADDGKLIVRKSDDFIMGPDIDLGSIDNIDNYEERQFTEEEIEAFNKLVEDNTYMSTLERTIDSAKQEKILEIKKYDNSENVNSFTINGSTMWLTVDERQLIATLISANESVGRTEMTKWFNGVSYTFPLTSWKQMLAALEVYAGDALNVTESHKHNVENLTSIEDIDNYDYTTGYPEKLSF